MTARKFFRSSEQIPSICPLANSCGGNAQAIENSANARAHRVHVLDSISPFIFQKNTSQKAKNNNFLLPFLDTILIHIMTDKCTFLANYEG